MVRSARSRATADIAHELDTALQKAIGRTLNSWGRRYGLPPLTWTVEHWDGYVTLVGRPPRRSRKSVHRAAQWTSRLNFQATDDGEPLWHSNAGGWHVEIQE